MLVTNIIDISEILSLQKEAFYEEAVKHNDLLMQPMVQTLKEIEEEFNTNTIFFKKEIDNQIVGSVRAYVENKICFIGKLVVAKEYQKRGVAIFLMNELEEYFCNQCTKFKLFTGEKSTNAINLYKKLGFSIINIQKVGSYNLVHFEKNIS